MSSSTISDLDLYMGEKPPEIGPRGGTTVKTIAKVAPRHEQIVNWFIANPHRTNADCAAFFGITQAWLSTIKRSDAYQARMRACLDEMAEETRAEYLAQLDLGTLGKLQVAADLAVEKLTEKIEIADDPEFLLNCTDKLLHRMGFAPKSTPAVAGPQSVTNNTLNVNVSAGDLAEARLLLSGGQVATPREIPVLADITEEEKG